MGPTAKELDSFNELIQFDHVYYKTLPQSKSAPQIQTSPIQTIRIKKDNAESDCNKSVVNNVQKLTENGYKNVKIIITSDSTNVKNTKIENSVNGEKVLTIPNVFIDKEALQKVTDHKNLQTSPQNVLFDTPTEILTNCVSDIDDNTNSNDLMDLNFDLLEDLENIISADFEGLSSTDDLSSHEQDNIIGDPVTDKKLKTIVCKRKTSDSIADSVIDLTANVPSPTKSLLSLTDSDYMSDSPSPYSSHDISSPLADTDSTLGENLWEESFTELFPDLL